MFEEIIDLFNDAVRRIRELFEHLTRTIKTVVDSLKQFGLICSDVSNAGKHDYRRDPFNGKRIDYRANNSTPYVLPRANRYNKSQPRKR